MKIILIQIKGGCLKLKLFELVDKTIEILNSNQVKYKNAERNINDFLVSVFSANENYIGYSSRVKSEQSIRSKIIRRKYYLEYEDPHDIIDNLSDIIGITLECRFISDEKKLFEQLKSAFLLNGNPFVVAKNNENIYLNFEVPQPQKQKNGFDNYRIDGYFLDGKDKINFELQIKSLINTFWSGIEHEVIYKNNNYLLFDSFLSELLISVKANLDTIDYQLTQIYNQMTNTENSGVGMDGTNFKSYLGKEINDLFSIKLKETIDIEADIKKVSALLSHYLYLEDFVKSDFPQMVMIQYFEKLNLLSEMEMDFTANIIIDEQINNGDNFTNIFGKYCLWIMNVDFDWHVLFSMLFMLQSDEVVVKFNNFVRFIKDLLFSPQWFKEKVAKLSSHNNFKDIESELLKTVADSLIAQKSVKIVYEENLYRVMLIIRQFFEECLTGLETGVILNQADQLTKLADEINQVFN